MKDEGDEEEMEEDEDVEESTFSHSY
jgi:hypothetical protein